jgi:hypothetical protein
LSDSAAAERFFVLVSSIIYDCFLVPGLRAWAGFSLPGNLPAGGVRPNQRSGTWAVSSKNPKKKIVLRTAFRFHTGLRANVCLYAAPGMLSLSAGLDVNPL